MLEPFNVMAGIVDMGTGRQLKGVQESDVACNPKKLLVSRSPFEWTLSAFGYNLLEILLINGSLFKNRKSLS